MSRTENEYCAEQLEAYQRTAARRGEPLVVAFHALSIPAELLFSPTPEVNAPLAAIHLASIVMMIGIIACRRLTGRRLFYDYWPVAVSMVATYLYFVAKFSVLGLPVDLMRSWTAYVGVSVMLIFACSYGGMWPMIAAVFLWALGAGVWLAYGNDPAMVAITLAVLAGVGGFYLEIVKGRMTEYRSQFRAQLAAARYEREKIEREMQLARAIQDSLHAPKTASKAGIDARCYQSKHAEVGGDWIAVREAKDGLVIMVVDAAGKGIQAALVVHAVQSLWAEALGDEEFDPGAWILRVNDALCRMGVTQPHAITAGILVVDGTKACYWSAGHVPVFVIEEKDGVEALKVSIARGDMLGINRKIALTPMTIPFTGPTRILLGSDGVFEKASRHSKKEILALEVALRDTGESALAARPAEDDKSVVVITVDPLRAARQLPQPDVEIRTA